MTLSQKLKACRKERRLSQADVADYLGVSAATYSAYETGRNEPCVKSIIALSQLYGVTTDSLLGVGGTSKTDKIMRLADMLTDEELGKAPEYINFLLWERENRG